MMNTVYHHRQGFVMEIIDTNGNTSYGEISPLPGLNSESMASALDNLKSVAAELPDINLPDRVDSMLDFTERIEMFPSVRFGIETALLNLLASRINTSLALLLNPNAAETVELNGLIISDSENIAKRINQYIEDGYKTIKIKVGKDIEWEKASLKVIIDVVNNYNTLGNSSKDENAVKIRLDANRSLSLNIAVNLFKGLDTACIEYIEEPLDDITQLCNFHNTTNVPVALDETITDRADLAEYFHSDFVGAFILKPTAIGSYKKMAEIYEKAYSAGKKAVISSCFESGIGLKALINIAAAFNKIPSAAGLDTYKWLKDDLTFASFDDFGPRVSIVKINATADYLNMNLLRKVPD